MTKSIVCIMPNSLLANYYRQGRPNAVELIIDSYIGETRREIELRRAGFMRKIDFQMRRFMDDQAIIAGVLLEQNAKWELLCHSLAPSELHPTRFYLEAFKQLPEYFSTPCPI